MKERLKTDDGFLQDEDLQQLKAYIDLIGPQIAKIHQKVLYDIYWIREMRFFVISIIKQLIYW